MSAQPGTARRTRLRLIATVAATAAAAIVLAGCGAGQKAGTADEVPVVDGVSANIGDIQVRAASVVQPDGPSYAAGSDARLELIIINNGAQADALTGVTTSQAKSTAFFPTQAAATTVPATADTGATDSTPGDSTAADSTAAGGSSSDSSAPGEDSSDSGASDSGSSDSGASASGASESGSSDAGSSDSAAAPASQALASIPLPRGQAVSIGFTADEQQLMLQGLTSTLFPATSFTITFQFQNAGSVSFPIAVHLAAPPSHPATAPTDDPSEVEN